MAKRTEKRGFGSIRRLPSGNYQARYTGPLGDVVPAPVTFVARMDAEAWLSDERRQLEQLSDWRAPKVRIEAAQREAEAQRLPILREYADQWVIDRRNSRGEALRPLTRDKYRATLRNHVYPRFGDLPLDEITRAAVREWHAGLQTGPVAKAHAYTTLRTILNTAVDEDELLIKNPARIRGAGGRARRKNLRPVTPAELQIIVEHMPERLGLLVLLATWCALRKGELRELRRSDIILGRDEGNEEVGWVQVSRGVVRSRTDDPSSPTKTVATVGAPKTDAGVRTVTIPDFLLPRVKDHLVRFAAPGPTGLLFYATRDNTKHIAEATLNGRPAVLGADGSEVEKGFGWREARRRAGRPDLDLHDLRHSGASWAGEEGASLAELMYRLGHSTPSMAIHYQHSRIERDREIARRLSARTGLRAV